MANYIAVIELHGAENEEDFHQLDVAMKELQFFPQIRDDNGEAYWLPTGSYAIQNADMVLRAAHDAAAGAAGESGFAFSVIATGFDECEWTNLPAVEALRCAHDPDRQTRVAVKTTSTNRRLNEAAGASSKSPLRLALTSSGFTKFDECQLYEDLRSDPAHGKGI